MHIHLCLKEVYTLCRILYVYIVGIADAAIMPLLALLADTRHVAVYGTVYAVVQLAISLSYGLGKPSVS